MSERGMSDSFHSHSRRSTNPNRSERSISFSPYIVVLDHESPPTTHLDIPEGDHEDDEEEVEESVNNKDSSKQNVGVPNRDHSRRRRSRSSNPTRSERSVSERRISNSLQNRSRTPSWSRHEDMNNSIHNSNNSARILAGSYQQDHSHRNSNPDRSERSISFSPFIVVLDRETPTEPHGSNGDQEDDENEEDLEEFVNEDSSEQAASVPIPDGGDSSSLSSEPEKTEDQAVQIKVSSGTSSEDDNDDEFVEARMDLESSSTSGSEASLRYFDAVDGET